MCACCKQLENCPNASLSCPIATWWHGRYVFHKFGFLSLLSKFTPVYKNTKQYDQEQQDDLSRPWRCEPCGYSTNINSNLRIHLSSEKHAIAVRKLDAVFLCGICTKFTSESAEQLEAHVNRWRHVDEDFGLTQQGDFFVCNLCTYKTQVCARTYNWREQSWQLKAGQVRRLFGIRRSSYPHQW